MRHALRIIGSIIGSILFVWLLLLALAMACRGALAIVDRYWPSDRPTATTLITRTDFPLCVTIKPPPLIRRKGVNLNPDRSDTA